MPDSISDRWKAVYPIPIEHAEAKLVTGRRPPETSDRPSDPDSRAMPKDTVGVALSGGGIRSATFCLGVFRALARAELVRKIDFLSTVSGGGYFGSFLGALFARHPDDPKATPDPAQVEAQLLDLHSRPLEWLRENGRYMSPNGAGDTLLAGAVLLRNWIAVLVVVLTAAVAAFAGIGVLLDRIPDALLNVSDQVGILRLRLTGAGVSPSPVLELPVLFVFLGVVPLGLGYWFTQRTWPFRSQWFLPPALTALVLLPALVWRADRTWGAFALLEGALATFWWVVAWALSRRERRPTDWWAVTWALPWRGRQQRDAGHHVDPEGPERNRLSRWLSLSLWTTVGLAVLAAVDSVGRTLASSPRFADEVQSVLAAAAVAALGAFAIVQKLLPLLGSVGGGKRISVPPDVLLLVLALAVGGLLLVGASTLGFWLGQNGWWLPLCSVVLTGVFAWTLPFLNLSSHNTLYSARLTRAYLGASNPKRHKGQGAISEAIAGDGVAFRDYRPFDHGGPLHLINVTLNETASGKSQLEQRDRKGLPFAIGPCGVSVGSRHHAAWGEKGVGRDLRPIKAEGDFQIFKARDGVCAVEELGLGEWISISGAAFTTGIGSRTSLALSLLLGLANVRLGYWWNSGIDPGSRLVGGKPPRGRLGRLFEKTLPVYAYLSYELLARFHGPARRRWYLSDGGHFENTGAYELLRRRVPFILLCDDGCDPEYEFQDLAGLVRKARLDFDAEIAFYPSEILTSLLPKELVGYFGAPGDFRRYGRKETASDQPQRPDGPHALLAGVFYEDPERTKRAPDSVLVILKPSVSGDEPLDVVEYGRTHRTFPQESTMDQFFDEAQWESYRRLGEHVASRVFANYASGTWQPSSLTPPPETDWPGTSRGDGGGAAGAAGGALSQTDSPSEGGTS